MKRIALILLTNLAVLVTLSVAAHLFNLDHFIDAQGLDFGVLLAFAALFGFGGAILSLGHRRPHRRSRGLPSGLLLRRVARGTL